VAADAAQAAAAQAPKATTAAADSQPFVVAPDVLAALDWPPELSLAEILPPAPALDEDEEEAEEEQAGSSHAAKAVPGMQAAAAGDPVVAEQVLEEGECVA
jgi:hypothetical protein